MKLIYRCMHCAAQNEFAYPESARHDVEFVLTNALSGYIEGVSGGARPWIRHPCAQGIHGIALLIAVED